MARNRTFTAATLALALAAAPASFVAAQEATPDTSDQTMQSGDQTMQSDDQSMQSGDDAAAPQANAQSETETPVFEDSQIEAFATAVMDVTEIRDQYASQLQGVEDEAEQQAIIEEANTEMRTAIEEVEGLTMEDYMAINRAASMDEDLNQRIAQRLQEMQSENAG